MTPDQLRALADELTEHADALDEIRRVLGAADAHDSPAVGLRTAAAYLRKCADAQPERQPASEPTRSERLREAGFTARDDRIECDECGRKFTAQMLPVHKCEPTDAHPMLCATHYCKDCAALWRQCDDFSFTLRSQACCTACNNAPVGGQLFALTTPVAMPRPSGPTEAQIEAAAYERAAQQCMLIASGVEHYTQYHEACSGCAEAIRALAAKEPK